jgi:hypothetical protein
MGFFEAYIFFGIVSMTTLVTFCLNQMFEAKHEKIGLLILWVIIFWLIVSGINKTNLLWLAPLAFVIPYYSSKLYRRLPREYLGPIIGITFFSVVLLVITLL